MVFNPLNGLLIEIIEAKGIFVRLNFTEEAMAQCCPFFLSNLAFEHGLLHALAIVFASLRNATQPALAGLFNGGNVISYEDEHGWPVNGDWRKNASFWNEGDVVCDIAAQMTREETRLNKRQLRDAQILIQQWVCERVLLALLIGFDHRFAACLGKFDSATFAIQKITRSDLLPVDEGDPSGCI